MFIDSHCHLDMEPLKNDMEGAIERAYKAGVEKMINVGSSFRGSKASIEIANSYPNIWATVGLHPHDSETVADVDSAIDELVELAKDERVVAVGEIGLDYYYLESKDLIPKQKELFLAQLNLAIKLDLPVIIHSRAAEEDTLTILSKLKGKNKNLRGVVHCFTGDAGFANKLVQLGFYIGFTGFITFDQEKFDHIREAVKEVPLEMILIETDAPFLAPEPYRGKTNEPAYVVEVAKKIAELKKVSLQEVAERTFQNAKKLFTLN